MKVNKRGMTGGTGLVEVPIFRGEQSNMSFNSGQDMTPTKRM